MNQDTLKESSQGVQKHNWTKTYLMNYFIVFKSINGLRHTKVVSHRVQANKELKCD